jgi:hypothetical protein
LACAFGIPTDKSAAMQAAKAINGSFLICSTSKTASLLQSAYSNYQIGAFENFHQLVEDTLIVLGPRLKVFFQYELRFANRIHRFYSSNKLPR